MSLRYTLLALLSKERNSGYGIGRLLQDPFSHLWGARLQQIYSELSKLEEQGLVEAELIEMTNRPNKKVYALTPAGDVALDQWLTEPPAPLLSKSDLLVKLYCLDRLPNDDVIVRRLEERQAEYEGVAHALRDKLTKVRQTDPVQLGYLLTLEAALTEAEGQATWCARAVASIRQKEGIASLPQARTLRSRPRTQARAARA